MKNLLVLCALICLSFTSTNVEDKLNTFVNNWHQAASNANFSEYFNSMSDDFVFLGTAPNERWNKI
jgi:ketosteroid isomerase-like protein